MNRKEWLECDNNEVKWFWRNKCEEIRKTLKYNPNPNATHKHHLFNTPEQIEYNNTHYEMWGFNEDGTFEYGKYIIFVTPEEHGQIHGVSEITKQRIRDSLPDRRGENNPMYGKHTSDLQKQHVREAWLGKHHTDETKDKISETKKSNPHPYRGKHLSEEHRKKISETEKGKQLTDEQKKKIGDANRGKVRSEEYKNKMRDTKKKQCQMYSIAYKEYKSNGGELNWYQFIKYFNKK